MNTQFDDFSDALPPELLQRAYRTSDGKELAWARTDAIQAISGLERAGFQLLGVDVWIPSLPGPKMTGRWWSVDKSGSLDAPQTALDFVNTFAWGPHDDSLRNEEPYFNLTVT